MADDGQSEATDLVPGATALDIALAPLLYAARGWLGAGGSVCGEPPLEAGVGHSITLRRIGDSVMDY